MKGAVMTKKEISTPQLYDRFMQRVAVAFFVLSLNYVADIVRVYSSEEVDQILGYASKASAIAVLLLILPSFIPLMRRRYNNKSACREPEGFIVEGFKKATLKAFSFTFLVLVYGQMFAEELLLEITGEVAIHFVLAMLLGTASVSFFFAIRDDSDEEDDDFGVEPEA